MSYESVRDLFELFTGVSGECCQTIIVEAIRTIYGLAKESADTTDIRFRYLAAAYASYDYYKIQSTVDKKKDYEIQINFCKQLIESYKVFCADLLLEVENAED